MAKVQCLFCDGELGETMFTGVRDRLGVSDKEWTFRRCVQCGSAVLDPMPTLEELLAAYPPTYHFDQVPPSNRIQRLLAALEIRLFYKPIYRSSVRQVQRMTGLKSGRILDVGGGSGRRSFSFQQAGFDVTVLDPDEQALKVAKEQFGLKTICGLLEEVDLPENSFDLVTLWYVVEHLPEPQKTLKAAHKVLRPNGWVVILVPLIDSWQARLFKGKWAEVTEAPRHVGLPTTKGMKMLLEICGFSFKAWESQNVWDNVGIFALSLVPKATTPVARGQLSPFAGLLWRGLGVLATFGGLPFAYMESLWKRPRAGVFFAQKE